MYTHTIKYSCNTMDELGITFLDWYDIDKLKYTQIL